MREFGSNEKGIRHKQPMPRSDRRWFSPLRNPIARRDAWASPLAVTLVLLSTSAVEAASLQQVNNWGASGERDDIKMYVYVPTRT